MEYKEKPSEPRAECVILALDSSKLSIKESLAFEDIKRQFLGRQFYQCANSDLLTGKARCMNFIPLGERRGCAGICGHRALADQREETSNQANPITLLYQYSPN